MQNKINYLMDILFDSNVMNHFLENILKLFMIVYILCNQIIGLNSKSSILWKLNDRSGKIYSFSDNDQHVSEIHHPLTHSLSLCVCRYPDSLNVMWCAVIHIYIHKIHYMDISVLHMYA